MLAALRALDSLVAQLRADEEKLLVATVRELCALVSPSSCWLPELPEG